MGTMLVVLIRILDLSANGNLLYKQKDSWLIYRTHARETAINASAYNFTNQWAAYHRQHWYYV